MCKGFFEPQSSCGRDCRGTVAYRQTISKLFAEPYLPVNSNKLVEIGNDKGKLAFNGSERSCKAVEPLIQKQNLSLGTCTLTPYQAWIYTPKHFRIFQC